MQKPATIKDIARILHVSTSTVSRALRNATDVNSETKSAVMALAEELDYQPNKLALSLLNKSTHTIGVIAPNLDYVLSTMIKGMDEVALEAGYTVMVCQSNESYGRELVNTRRLMDSLVDGLLFSVSSETKVFDHIKKMLDRNVPLVIFDRDIPEIKAPKVMLDNYSGGYVAGEHLAQQGYKKIALLLGPKNLTISNQRETGFKQALKDNGIRLEQELVIHCDFNQEYAYLATKELLALKKRPDAIFTISDRMGIGAMRAIKEKGLKMPDEIGLVSFNNEPIVSLLTPAISSVEIPAFELGKETARLFIEMINSENRDNFETILLKPKLFIRESSRRI